MLPRVWIVLLTVLLLAAPAGGALAESVDSHAESGACDVAVIQLAVALPKPTPARIAIIEIATPMPQSPALFRIFRPPRPAFV